MKIQAYAKIDGERVEFNYDVSDHSEATELIQQLRREGLRVITSNALHET